MTTTISVSEKGEVALPEQYRRRKKIKPGTALRVTEVGNGLYVTPVPEPSERELREVAAAAGSLSRHQTAEDEKLVHDMIVRYRKSKRRKG